MSLHDRKTTETKISVLKTISDISLKENENIEKLCKWKRLKMSNEN